MIKKWQPLHAPMEHLHIAECHLVFVMPLPLSNVACCQFLQTWSRTLWMTFQSTDQILRIASIIYARYWKDVKKRTLNWEKCHFTVNDGIVLGHKVFAAGIEVDRAKIEVMTGLPAPKNVRDVRSFLGHAGFYRRFIQDFSKIARPLNNLLCKEVKLDFTPECMKAFDD